MAIADGGGPPVVVGPIQEAGWPVRGQQGWALRCAGTGGMFQTADDVMVQAYLWMATASSLVCAHTIRRRSPTQITAPAPGLSRVSGR